MNEQSASNLLDLTFLKKRVADLEAREFRLQAECEGLRQFLKRSPLCYHSLDENGCISRVNQTWLDKLGYAREEVMGIEITEFLHSDYRESFHHDFLRCRDGAERVVDEMRMLKKDGSSLWVTIHDNLLKDHQDDFQQIVCFYQDISVMRKQCQSDSEGELQRICHSSDTLARLINGIIGFFRNLTGCEAVGVRLSCADDFPYFETRGFPEVFVRAENSLCSRDHLGALLRDSSGNPVLECMCGNIVSGRFDPTRPFFTPFGSFWTNSTSQLLATTSETDRQAKTRNRCNGEGYESVALIPLRDQETTFGLVQFNDRHTGRFTKEGMHRLERLVSSAAITIAKFFTDEKLRKSESKYRFLFEQAQEAIIIAQGGILEMVNPAAVRLIGYSEKELTSTPFLQFVHPEDQEVVADHHKRRLRGEEVPATYSFRVINRDKLTRWMEQTGSLILWNGKPASLNFLTDITERRQMEHALRASEADLRRALEIARLGTWEYDVVSDRFLFNDQFYSLYHTSAEREGWFVMSSVQYAKKFIHPDDSFLVGVEMQKALDTTDPDYFSRVDHRIICADGAIRSVAVYIRVIKDKDGRTLKTYGANQDITEQKRVEDALNTSLTEKEVLLREVHHRVKNNLAVVISLFDLQRQAMNDPQSKTILAELSSRVRAMSLVHEKLYRSDILSGINFHQYIESLISHIRTTFGSPAILYDVAAQGVMIPLDLAVPCGMIINELVVNAFKYAFPGNRNHTGAEGGHIVVSLVRENGALTLSVADNGVGFPPGFDWTRTKTLGLVLVRMLGRHQLTGSYVVDQSEGTRFTLTFSEKNGK